MLTTGSLATVVVPVSSESVPKPNARNQSPKAAEKKTPDASLADLSGHPRHHPMARVRIRGPRIA
jgi:hypothetical protein